MNTLAALRELRSAAEAAADLLLPRECVVCNGAMDRDEDTMVCGRCWARVPMLPSPRCDRCGHPLRDLQPRTSGASQASEHAPSFRSTPTATLLELDDADRCRWCELLPPFVRSARSVAWAAGNIGLGIVHAIKYGGWHRVAGEIATRMARVDFPVDVIEERRALVPVPLSSKRRRERGYNQSELLAQSLSRRWHLPVWNEVLDRVRHTETQTRLTPGDRLRNVSGAFCAPDSAKKMLRGAHVIVVDDVVTTAATLNACAAALCAGGARIVSYVTFGRAPALGDRW
jgi:ComF family protein